MFAEADDALYRECMDSFEEVYNIGDSDNIGDIRLAVRAGYRAETENPLIYS